MGTPIQLLSAASEPRDSSWLPRVDSNHNTQIQSLVSYRWTNRQLGRPLRPLITFPRLNSGYERLPHLWRPVKVRTSHRTTEQPALEL